MEPRCILGPGELCATLDESVTDCEHGDGQACLAVGQYLADTPPRPLIAISFFLYACKAGEQDGCARMKEIKDGPARPCEEDIFTCAWQGYRGGGNAERLDDACSLGVADACAWLEDHYKDDAPRARAYLETSCQLGNPMACQELGRRLTAGCAPGPDGPCYPPDAGEAAEAKAIACEAGFAEACT
jgi:TPR repeat protein